MLCVFGACFVCGILCAAISFIKGHQGLNHGVGSGVRSIFNPLVIASTLTAYGAIGLISVFGFGIDEKTSMAVSLVLAALVGTIVFFGVVRVMVQSESVFSMQELIGMDAEVKVTIPKNNVGEVSCVIRGVRHTFAAKSRKTEEISQGVMVTILEVSGSLVLVERKLTIQDVKYVTKNIEHAGN